MSKTGNKGGGDGGNGGKDADDASRTFEANIAELEDITRRMESGDVPLDESLRLYERGTQLVRRCQEQVDAAQKKVEELSRTPAGGLTARPRD